MAVVSGFISNLVFCFGLTVSFIQMIKTKCVVAAANAISLHQKKLIVLSFPTQNVITVAIWIREHQNFYMERRHVNEEKMDGNISRIAKCKNKLLTIGVGIA